MPFVAFSLAIILFEGGLTLRFSELRKSGNVIVRMIIICTAVTWCLNTLAAYFILSFNLIMSLLLGVLF